MSSKYISVVIALTIFLLPIFYWTSTPNFFATPKELIFILATIALLVHTAFAYFQNRQSSSPHISLVIPLGIFFLSIVGSLIANPEGRPEALASKGMILLLLPITALIISLTSNHAKLIKHVAYAILGSSTILALHSLLSLTFLSKSPYLPSFMQSTAFTPTGSYLSTLIIIVIGLSFAINLFKQPSQASKTLSAGLMILHTISIVAIVSLMFPGSALTPNFIPFQASWSIALDALKSLRSLFFGIGLSNYSLLFSAVKPVSLNLSTNWLALQASNTSELLTLLPTAGILATLSLLYLMIKGLVWSKGSNFSAPFILVSLSLLLLPTPLIVYFLFFTILALTAPKSIESDATVNPSISKLIGIFFGLLALIVIYISGHNFLSEFYIRLSQTSLDGNDSKSAYDYHRQALRFSPNITNYHLSFAEINFRLATALSQKENLTDADRETITSLIQQSIQSGKNAIQLRPNYSSTWLTVAKIYQNLINVADGADKFAVEAYTRAIALDRANPLLRLDYGNLLSQLSDADKNPETSQTLRNRAKAEIQTAIQLKSDYANAYYNLAKLYEIDEDYPNAVLAMQQVLKYLDPTSNDFLQAQATMDTLKTKLPKQSPTPTPSPSQQPIEPTIIATPTPLPSPLNGGPIDLPDNEL